MKNLDLKVELYVGEKVDFMSEVILLDIADGNGPFIAEWNLTSKPKPTDAQLDAFEDAAKVVVARNLVLSNRRAEYEPIPDQLDMIYWDGVNGSTKWQDHIKAVKKKYPKE